jgi:hypothetical protein
MGAATKSSSAGEVVLIRIDLHQKTGGKVRPAVVLLDERSRSLSDDISDIAGAAFITMLFRSWQARYGKPIFTQKLNGI